MPLQRFHPRSNHKILTSLLVLALLLAQWSGLNHRIMHGVGQGSAGYYLAIGPAPNSVDGSDLAHHSCVAFDAATLAAAIYSAPFAAPTLPNLHVLALWIAFASWRAPFSCHFLSRAPPTA
ncbi:MAG TPA: hypothetical protein VL051_10690 [Burkholderiaceae bacterium]|nr:hypothetical protein [Burkholderiaceae bacterium]